MSGESQYLRLSYPKQGASEYSPSSSHSLSASGSLEQMEDHLLRSSGGVSYPLASAHRGIASTFADPPSEDDGQCCTRNTSRNTDFSSPEATSLDCADEDGCSEADGFASEDLDGLESFLASLEGEKSYGSAPSGYACHYDAQVMIRSGPPSGSKRGSEDLDGDDEVESRFQKRHRRDVESDTSVEGAVSGESFPLFEERSCDDSCLDHCCADEMGDEIQMLCDDLGAGLPVEQCSSCIQDRESTSSGSARESRRQKMKDTVKLLRDVIPGGDCLDPANILDDAINYVQLLQLQVRTLADKRLSKLPQ